MSIKVYIDSNVLIDIESNASCENKFRDFPNTEYYFSHSHLDELLEGRNIPKINVQSRLDLIDRLAGQNFILSNVYRPEFMKKSALEAWLEVNDNAYFRYMLNEMSKDFNIERARLVNYLELNQKEINNVSSEKIIPFISEKLINKEGYNIDDYLSKTCAVGRGVYVSLFNYLDFVCFHKDKQTEHSNIARMHDASHA